MRIEVPQSSASRDARSIRAAARRVMIDSAWLRELARPGQLHRPRSAGAVEEPVADVALERRDLLADRRLRVPELQRRRSERPLLGHGPEGRQVADLHPEPEVVVGALGGCAHQRHCYACA